jgi:parallel beta-helix repeat protein
MDMSRSNHLPRPLLVLLLAAVLAGRILPAMAAAHPSAPPEEEPGSSLLRKPPPLSVAGAPHGARTQGEDCVAAGTSLQPRPPISIDGDADLTSPASGVRSGSGTAADPYVISGWYIPWQGDDAAAFIGVHEPAHGWGIRVRGTTKHLVIKNNVIGGTGYPQGPDNGIEVQAPNITIEGNTICSTILEGIVAQNSPGVVIRDNIVSDARAGIWTYDSEAPVVTGNHVNLSMFGIALDSAAGADISRNNVDTLAFGQPSFTAGIYCNFCGDLQLTDNVIRGTGEFGFDEGVNVYDAPNAVVTGNEVIGVGTYGFILGYLKRGLIENNLARNNGLSGMLLWDDWVKGDNVVTANELNENGSYGPGLGSFRSGLTVVDTDANLIETNTAAGNYFAGFQIYATDNSATPNIDPTFDNVFRDVSATGTQVGPGVAFEGDRRTIVANASITDNPGGGVSLVDSSAHIDGNLIEGNGGTGVLVVGGTAEGGATVSGNTVSDNKRGIALQYAIGHTFRHNVLEDNAHGVFMEGTVADHYRNDIDSSNTVGGRPILVIEDATGSLDWADSDPAFLALVNPHDLLVRAVDARSSGQGLVVFGGEGVRIEGAHFEDNQIGVDVVRSHGVTLTDVTVTGGQTGIRVFSDTSDTRIENTAISDVETGVLSMWQRDVPDVGFGMPERTTISGSSITRASRTGVEINGRNTTITGTTIKGPTATAVLVMGGPVLVEDSQVLGAGDRGIHTISDGTEVRGTTISGFVQGIYAFHAAGLVVEGSRVAGNGTGLYSTGHSDGASISGSTISGNDRGVLIYGEVNDVVVDCNRIAGNTREGVALFTLTVRPRVTRNLIEGNEQGLFLNGISGTVSDNSITKNETGVVIGGAAIPSNTFTANNLEGNTSMGATAFTAGDYDGTLLIGTTLVGGASNWWGDASGPSATGNPTGTGDRAGDQINYRAWLTQPDTDAGACAAALPA